MRIKLKEVISDFIVPMRDKPKVFNGNVPWCRIEDIQGKYLYKSLSNQNVSEECIKEMNLKVYPLDTLLFTCSASIGITAITKELVCTNQTFIGLVPSDKIDTEYLYYYLNKIGDSLKKSASITTIPYLPRRFFEELVVDIPDNINIQRRIAKILSDFDAKIELNNHINRELEAMAKTLYDYWFVQFDFPNEQGKPYKSSGGIMVYNPELKREIPENWVVEKIVNNCDIIDCLHSMKPDYKYVKEKCYLLQLENIKDDGLIDLSNKYFVSEEDYLDWTSRIEVKENDIVITNAGRVGATAQISKNVIAGIGRNITAIRPISISSSYLFLAFRGLDMKRQIAWNTDKGAFFTSLNVKGIKKLYVLRPIKTIEENFEKMVSGIRKKRELIQIQNQQLSELRDWLLPMLINGQVEVKTQNEESVLNIAAEPLFEYEKKTRTIPLDAHILGGHIVNRLQNSRGMGRTKLQKALHLVEYHCQMELNSQSMQFAAGPHDQEMMNYIDQKFFQFQHVKKEKEYINGKTHYKYIPTNRIQEIECAYENINSQKRKEIDNLLYKIATMDLARTEIVSTLYAVWNNRLIAKQVISKDDLLQDFYDWSKHKHDFPKELVLKALDYMREEGITPIGWGKYIDKRE